MDRIEAYRQIICEFLETFSQLGDSYQLIFDRDRDRYLVMNNEWRYQHRIYGCAMQLDIIDGQIWIQQNNTEIYVDEELIEKGVARKDIVLGFRSPSIRELIAASQKEAS